MLSICLNAKEPARRAAREPGARAREGHFKYTSRSPRRARRSRARRRRAAAARRARRRLGATARRARDGATRCEGRGRIPLLIFFTLPGWITLMSLQSSTCAAAALEATVGARVDAGKAPHPSGSPGTTGTRRTGRPAPPRSRPAWRPRRRRPTSSTGILPPPAPQAAQVVAEPAAATVAAAACTPHCPAVRRRQTPCRLAMLSRAGRATIGRGFAEPS